MYRIAILPPGSYFRTPDNLLKDVPPANSSFPPDMLFASEPRTPDVYSLVHVQRILVLHVFIAAEALLLLGIPEALQGEVHLLPQRFSTVGTRRRSPPTSSPRSQTLWCIYSGSETRCIATLFQKGGSRQG